MLNRNYWTGEQPLSWAHKANHLLELTFLNPPNDSTGCSSDYICHEHKWKSCFKPVNTIHQDLNTFYQWVSPKNFQCEIVSTKWLRTNFLSHLSYSTPMWSRFGHPANYLESVLHCMQGIRSRKLYSSFVIGLHQWWGTYLLSQTVWVLRYHWRAAKSITFILKFYLYLIMSKGNFSWLTI